MSAPESPERQGAPYQSLYRRFRPQRFSEVLGQEFVSLALQNAVREERVGHAYLFSGPRGTGKTSTARILAKALNCEAPVDGEPCGACGSCTEIAAGSSLDVHELDAASNNGVDAMRDLVARAALGTPGRWKVYIVDEVHMLSAAASNALLKTLEEPPGHVVFVLATTDPQKVLATIRSRTQHFEFRLLGAETLHGLLESVRSQAGLELPDNAVETAVRRGRGSARDALSVLDQVAAAGIVEPDATYLDELAEALCVRDSHAALVAVASAVAAGRDPLSVAGELADHLRQGFLAVVAPELVGVDGEDRTFASGLATKMGLPALVRAIEALGAVQVEMRESPDPRLHVEVCLLRLTRPEADDSMASLLERIDRLERAVTDISAQGSGVHAASVPGLTESAPPASVGAPVASEVSEASGPAAARRSLGALRREKAAREAGAEPSQTSPPPPGPPRVAAPDDRPEPSSGDESPPARPVPEGPAMPLTATAAQGTFPSRDELVQAWGDGLLASLPQRPRARFKVGRFTEVDPGSGVAVFALPNEAHRYYCEEVTTQVEVALSGRFGVPVSLRLIVDPDEVAPPGAAATRAPRADGAPAAAADLGPGGGEDDDLLDPEVLEAETEPAGEGLSPEDRLKLTFPGAEEV